MWRLSLTSISGLHSGTDDNNSILVGTHGDLTLQSDSYAGAAAADSLASGRGAARLFAALRTATSSTQAVERRA